MSINTVKNVRKLFMLSRETMKRVAAFKLRNQMRSESEAIRTLIEAGLEATQKEKTK
jgi:hypothetical protein